MIPLTRLLHFPPFLLGLFVMTLPQSGCVERAANPDPEVLSFEGRTGRIEERSGKIDGERWVDIRGWPGEVLEFNVELWQNEADLELTHLHVWLLKNMPERTLIRYLDTTDDGSLDTLTFSHAQNAITYWDYGLDGVFDVLSYEQQLKTFVLFENNWIRTVKHLGLGEKKTSINVEGTVLRLEFTQGVWRRVSQGQ